MIFNAKNKEHRKIKVYAYTGLTIKGVTKYNTKTREIELLLLGETEDGGSRVITTPTRKKSAFPRKVIKVKITIPGSYALYNGKKY